jgi:hypothetical protein
MEQQNEVFANETNEIVASKVVVKKTIPQKQKTTIKLVMWALSHVMEREAMLVKIDEIFKLKDTSIETIIEMVDAVEKSAEYLVMDTELGALRQKEKSRREKVTGDPDTIIKQLVDMAKDEVKPAKKTKKVIAEDAAVAEGTDAVVKEKKPRAKKGAAAADTDTVKTKKPRTKKTDIDYSPERPSPAFLPDLVQNVESDSEESVEAKAPDTVKVKDEVALKDAQWESPVIEDKKKPKPRAKKTAAVVEEDKKKPKPRAKKTAAVADAVTEGAVAAVVEEDKKKPKPRAKKAVTDAAAAVVSEDGSVVEEDKKKPKTKAKAKAKEEVPVVVHEVEESLEEDEYLLLNEVVVEGETYMVDSNQNIYDEFNKIIGKYDNGVVVLNA